MKNHSQTQRQISKLLDDDSPLAKRSDQRRKLVAVEFAVAVHIRTTQVQIALFKAFIINHANHLKPAFVGSCRWKEQ
jgi:hypothetical protein